MNLIQLLLLGIKQPRKLPLSPLLPFLLGLLPLLVPFLPIGRVCGVIDQPLQGAQTLKNSRPSPSWQAALITSGSEWGISGAVPPLHSFGHIYYLPRLLQLSSLPCFIYPRWDVPGTVEVFLLLVLRST